MSKAILFVCQSCHSAHSKPTDRPLDGAILCDRLLTLHQDWSRRSPTAEVIASQSPTPNAQTRLPDQRLP